MRVDLNSAWILVFLPSTAPDAEAAIEHACPCPLTWGQLWLFCPCLWSRRCGRPAHGLKSKHPWRLRLVGGPQRAGARAERPPHGIAACACADAESGARSCAPTPCLGGRRCGRVSDEVARECGGRPLAGPPQGRVPRAVLGLLASRRLMCGVAALQCLASDLRKAQPRAVLLQLRLVPSQRREERHAGLLYPWLQPLLQLASQLRGLEVRRRARMQRLDHGAQRV
mmetsp:Transcript_75675/g.195026  ORF Transcript_75675/g.195026 Transcript_75675/m.195026 type:complete len:226 (-) Transcript_75675:823-1500(-)